MMDNIRYDAFDPVTGATFFPRVYKDFPYAERFCRYCEQKLDVINAIHHQEHIEIYKAVMMCDNPGCGAYDEEARSAYIRVYYSCEEALQLFETIFLRFAKIKKT